MAEIDVLDARLAALEKLMDERRAADLRALDLQAEMNKINFVNVRDTQQRDRDEQHVTNNRLLTSIAVGIGIIITVEFFLR